MDGELIKAAIKKAGKTQRDVASGLKMSRENLNKILSGDVPDAMVKMIESVGVDLTFVNKSGDMKNYATPERYEMILQSALEANKNLLKAKDEIIKAKEEALQMAKSNMETYKAIVDQGRKDGTLRFVGDKSK